jgi:hypothetical protein
MNYTDFLTLVDAALQQSLSSFGFRRSSAGTWNRRNGEELNVNWFQKHSTDPSFCVNLGVHYTFLPKAGTEAPITGDSIEQPDCEIKLRLTETPAAKDQWWPISEQSINGICGLIESRGIAVFDSYRLSGPIVTMEGKDIEAGNLGLLSAMTKVRACLLLARLHEHLGNRDKCVDAATCGIKVAGMAVGPKRILRDILNRCEGNIPKEPGRVL